MSLVVGIPFRRNRSVPDSRRATFTRVIGLFRECTAHPCLAELGMRAKW